MTKTELVIDLAHRTGMSKAQSSRALDVVFELVSGAMGRQDSIRIPGFGTFDSKLRSARQGRNPGTGDVMEIPEKRVVRFRPASALVDRVAG